MTAFSPTDIPASVDSLEKLVVWGNTILNDLYPGTTAIEATGQASLVVTSAPFYITASDPATWRIISRTSIPLLPSWRRRGKIWEYAQDIGGSAIPSEYKAS